MEEKPHIAYIVAGGLTAIAYVVLLIVLHIGRFCMRKCPTFITGRQPRDLRSNPQIPQQSGRRVIVMTAQELMAQGITIPNNGINPEMLPANLNSPMTAQQTTQFGGQNRIVGNTQNFLTQEKVCQNNENFVLNNGGYPVISSQPITPSAPPCY